MRHRRQQVVEHHLHLAADHVGQRRRRAAVRHVLHLDAGHRHEQLGRQMDGGAVAGGGIADLAGIGFRIGDELGDGLGRHRRVHLHDVRPIRDAGDRRDVVEEVVRQLLVERGVDRVRRRDDHQRVAVGRRRDDRLRRHIAAGARPVLHDDLLAEPVRQTLRHDARHDVGRPAGRESDDRGAPRVSDMDRLRAMAQLRSERRKGRAGKVARCSYGPDLSPMNGSRAYPQRSVTNSTSCSC